MVMRKVMVAVLVTGLVAGNGSTMNPAEKARWSTGDRPIIIKYKDEAVSQFSEKNLINMTKHAIKETFRGLAIGAILGTAMQCYFHKTASVIDPLLPLEAAYLGAQITVSLYGILSLRKDMIDNNLINALKSIGIYGGMWYLLAKKLS